MAKTVLIVRGSLGATSTSDVLVIHNPKMDSVARKQEMPSSLNADDLLVKEPGSQKIITMKALKEKIG